MKISRKRRLVALLGVPLMVAFVTFGLWFVHDLRDVDRPVAAPLCLGATLLLFMAWMSWLDRIVRKEDAGAIRCECGGLLYAVPMYETEVQSVGRCERCGRLHRLLKKGNSHGEEGRWRG